VADYTKPGRHPRQLFLLLDHGCSKHWRGRERATWLRALARAQRL